MTGLRIVLANYLVCVEIPHNRIMLSLLKSKLSRRWLAFFLMAAVLPLILFGWWSMKSINALLDNEARRSLSANGHLLQMMIQRSQMDQSHMTRQTLRYLLNTQGQINEKTLLTTFFPPSNGWAIILSKTGDKDASTCYFERQSDFPAPLKLWSSCRVSLDGWQLVSRKPFTLETLAPAIDKNFHLQFQYPAVENKLESSWHVSFAKLVDRLRGRLHHSLSLPLSGVSGKREAVLTVSESSDLMVKIRERRKTAVFVFFFATLAFILYLAKRFKEEVIHPVQAISDIAEQVSQGRLETRLPETLGYTPMQKTARQFNQMLDQLAEKQQLQDNFIANLTHDLQTPLLAQERAFELFSEEFIQYNLPHLEALSDGLVKNNRHLLSMISQLLETYQFDAGKLTLHMQSLSLVEILQDCAEQLRPLADEKEITIHTTSEKPERLIQGDIRALHRIFLNIIGNAIANIPRYSTICITIDHDNERFCVAIRDNGPGLPSEERLHLFDRFYGGISKKRKIGSGLGLYICKMLTEAHQGAITVDSKPGAHTTVTVYLPIERG